MSDATSLYRLFDPRGHLLYIGVASNPGRRFDQHSKDKAWWGEVSTIKIEHHPTRVAALLAERDAIIAEGPQFNVVHNRPNGGRRGPERKDWSGPGRWRMFTHHGHERVTDLWLYPEINMSACVDDVYWADGEEQLEYFIQQVRERCPEAWERDALGIGWFVRPIEECAPFSETFGLGNMLEKGYTWPEDVRSGEPVDWFQLPVRMDRFPEFSKALSFTPSPLQQSFPVRSFWRSRNAD